MLKTLTTISTIATPIVLALMTGLGWLLGTGIEREFQRQDAENKRIYELNDELRSNRIEIYNKILEPFIVLLMTEEAWRLDPANQGRDREVIAKQILLSLEYRHKVLSLPWLDQILLSRSTTT